MDIQKKRIQLVLFVVGLIAVSFAAEKCRQLVGEDSSSKSGKFTIFNCFDMSSGTLACTVKEGVKLYAYNLRASHVEKARITAIEQALVDALGQGMAAKDATQYAQKEAAKAAKLASRKAKRILGPIVSSGWDFFEALYYGGTITEGFLRGSGTLAGAYAGGLFWEQSLGRFGYLVGSHLGSWIGGRIGLMVYDVVNGLHILFQSVSPSDSDPQGFDSYKLSEVSSDAYGENEINDANYETYGTAESNDQFKAYEAPTYDSTEQSRGTDSANEQQTYDTPEPNELSEGSEESTFDNSESYDHSEFR